jgi:dimethyl sulfoxide reductase iron-sulfur subunit
MVKQYGLVFDLKRCIGCHTCSIACKVENRLKDKSWIKVLTSNGLSVDLPVGRYPNLSLSWQPTTCMHCQKPPCIESCPETAIQKRQDGIVSIDKERCNGCRLCESACPYGAIYFNSETGKAEKCTLCSHRIDEGLEPFCVKECVTGAIHFGDSGDPDSEVSKLIAQRKGSLEKPESGTKPSNYYLRR